MRIGDTIDAGLNQIDYSPYLNAQARATSSIGASIGAGAGAVGDAVKDRREKKDAIKVSKELAKALSTLYPESAGAVMPIIDQLDNEELPLSQRAALGDQIGTLINMGVEKNRNDALMSLERSRLGLETRRVDLAESSYKAEGQAAISAAMSENDIKAQEAFSRYAAIKDMEAPILGQLPKMDKSEDLISKYIEEGNGEKALNAVEAYEAARMKQMEPLLGAPQLRKIGGTDASGQAIDIDAFITPTGDVFGLDRQQLNAPQGPATQGGLPATPDAATDALLPPLDDPRRTIPPPSLPKIGIRPSGSTVARTPEQVRKEQLEITKLEGDVSKQEAEVGIAQRANDTAIAKGRLALDTLRGIRQHPGRWAATGKSSYLPSVRGSKAWDFEQKLEQAKALAGTIGIEAMRGLGAMSEKEFAAATASIAQLDKGQRVETIEAELDNLIELFESKIKAVQANPADPAKFATDRLRSLKPPKQ